MALEASPDALGSWHFLGELLTVRGVQGIGL